MFAIFVLQLLAARTLGDQAFYASLGCFKDDWNRALPEILDPRFGGDCPYLGYRDYHNLPNAIELCAKCTAFKGYKVFAVQDSGLCFSGVEAEKTYAKYGQWSSQGNRRCSKGTGGPLLNDVYRIIEGSRDQCAVSVHLGDHCYGSVNNQMPIFITDGADKQTFTVPREVADHAQSLMFHGACKSWTYNDNTEDSSGVISGNPHCISTFSPPYTITLEGGATKWAWYTKKMGIDGNYYDDPNYMDNFGSRALAKELETPENETLGRGFTATAAAGIVVMVGFVLVLIGWVCVTKRNDTAEVTPLTAAC